MHAPGRAQWATALWYSGLSGSILIGMAVRACTRRSRGSCRRQAPSARQTCEVGVGGREGGGGAAGGAGAF